LKQVRALWRLLGVVAGVVGGIWTIRTRFGRYSEAQRQQAVQDWSRRMLQRMGVSWTVHGTPPAQGPVLVVSNHISWLDILAINAARPCRFVSKADVKHWPVVGRLVEGAGTLFIERERRRDAMRVVHHLAERLQAGDVLAVFPEGTTGDGTQVLPFHANLLQAAIATQRPVQALGLSYRHAGSDLPHAAPTYIGDTTLVASVWSTLKATDVQVVLRFAEPEAAQGRDRRQWAEDLRQHVGALLAWPSSGAA
jgi:1-acyl-sn-glycerol-3-phosphate acyltransferase